MVTRIIVIFVSPKIAGKLTNSLADFHANGIKQLYLYQMFKAN